jgi:phage baseplate assembly protein V
VGGLSSELERRISELARVGVISEIQPEKGLCRVSFGETRVSPLSPWFMRRAGKDKEFWHPDIGEQAVFFSPYGDGSEGFVLVGLFSNKMPLPEGAKEGLHIVEYEDGTRMEVDRKNHVLSLTDSYGSAIKMQDGYIDLYPAVKVRIRKGGK